MPTVIIEVSKPLTVCPNTADDAPYGLECVLPRGHEGECHAHWFGFGGDDTCSCGLKPEACVGQDG